MEVYNTSIEMKVVIAGAGAMGTHLTKLLASDKVYCTLIDPYYEKLAPLETECDILTITSTPTSINALVTAGVRGADLFIAVTPHETTNITCSVLAKALGAKKTVARIDNFEYINPDTPQVFPACGVDALIYPEVLAAEDIIKGLKMTWVRQRWDIFNGELVLLAIKMRTSAEILNIPLKQLCGPLDPYHVVAIKRGQETIIPGGNDVLEDQDLAYFMTRKEYIPTIRKLVGKADYEDVRNVMIMGGDKAAVRTAHTIPDYMNLKIIECDEERCNKLNELIDKNNVMVIHGDGRDMSLLREENISNTQAFVALTGNAETNILACLAAKRRGVRKTIAQVENVDYISMAESLDIGTIINKKIIAAGRIYQMLLDDDLRNVKFLMTSNADVAELTASEDSKITRKPVKDLGLPRGVTIGGLMRDGHGMLVSGMTQIKAGDQVMIFSHNVNIRKIEQLFK